MSHLFVSNHIPNSDEQHKGNLANAPFGEDVSSTENSVHIACKPYQSSDVSKKLHRKHQLNNIIVNKDGTPDYLAINIYWDTLRSWYKPLKTHNIDGSVVETKKLKTKGIYTSYNKLVELYAVSKETIRKKLVKLESLGLINRSFQHKSSITTKSFNQVIIYLWKHTPFFYNEFGIDRDDIVLTPYTSHLHIADKHHIVFSSKPLLLNTITAGGGVQPPEDTKELMEVFSIEKTRSISNFEKIEKSNFSEKRVETKFSPSKFKKPKKLSDFYPLEQKDVEELQRKSDREFRGNAMNEILKDMSRKLETREHKPRFWSKKGFMAYMSKVFAYEKRDACKINNETFRIRANQTEEEALEQIQEQYLTEIEYNRQVSPEWHFKKKLTSVLERDTAYRLLRALHHVEVVENVLILKLTKQVELSDREREIILDQARATHERFERGEWMHIASVEYVVPEEKKNREKGNKVLSESNSESLERIYETKSDSIWCKIRECFIEKCRDGVHIDMHWLSKLKVRETTGLKNADSGQNPVGQIGKIEEITQEEVSQIELEAPSDFYRNWIETRYLESLQKIAESMGRKLVLF